MGYNNHSVTTSPLVAHDNICACVAWPHYFSRVMLHKSMAPAVTPIDVTLFGTIGETQQRLDQDAGDRIKIRKSGKGVPP